MPARILLDLNSPVFFHDFLSLEKTELSQVVKVLRRIRGMDWEAFVRPRGSRWEKITHITAPNG